MPHDNQGKQSGGEKKQRKTKVSLGSCFLKEMILTG